MVVIPATASKGIHVPAYAVCLCGLHKQAPLAQGRSSAAPPVVGASAPRAGKPSRSATPLASPRRRRARPHLPKIPGGMVCLTPWLRQPASGLPAQLRVPPPAGAHGPCPQASQPARRRSPSPSAPLRARSGRSRSLRGHCAGSASPLRGLAPQRREEREECAVYRGMYN